MSDILCKRAEQSDFRANAGDGYSGRSSSAARGVSVVVPVYRGGDHFKRSLESIVSATRSEDEVVVVADGGHPDDVAACRSMGIEPIVLCERRGPAFARNRGVEASSHELIVFIDADVLLTRDARDRLVTAFAENPAISAVIGSYDDRPADRSLVSRYRNLLHHFTHQNADERAMTFWGACGAIRRCAFNSLGGFDERFDTPSVEDIELGYRLSQAGYRIRLAKDIQVKHLKTWTLYSMVTTDVFKRAMPWTELMLSHRAFKSDLNVRAENRASVVLVFLAIITLGVSAWNPWLLIVSMICVLSVLALNYRFYRLLMERGGLGFALASAPLHLAFYLYGGIGLILGVLRHAMSGLRTRGASYRPGRLV